MNTTTKPLTTVTLANGKYQVEKRDEGYVVWIIDPTRRYTLPQTKPTAQAAMEYAEGWFKL